MRRRWPYGNHPLLRTGEQAFLEVNEHSISVYQCSDPGFVLNQASSNMIKAAPGTFLHLRGNGDAVDMEEERKTIPSNAAWLVGNCPEVQVL